MADPGREPLDDGEMAPKAADADPVSPASALAREGLHALGVNKEWVERLLGLAKEAALAYDPNGDASPGPAVVGRREENVEELLGIHSGGQDSVEAAIVPKLHEILDSLRRSTAHLGLPGEEAEGQEREPPGAFADAADGHLAAARGVGEARAEKVGRRWLQYLAQEVFCVKDFDMTKNSLKLGNLRNLQKSLQLHSTYEELKQKYNRLEHIRQETREALRRRPESKASMQHIEKQLMKTQEQSLRLKFAQETKELVARAKLRREEVEQLLKQGRETRTIRRRELEVKHGEFLRAQKEQSKMLMRKLEEALILRQDALAGLRIKLDKFQQTRGQLRERLQAVQSSLAAVYPTEQIRSRLCVDYDEASHVVLRCPTAEAVVREAVEHVATAEKAFMHPAVKDTTSFLLERLPNIGFADVWTMRKSPDHKKFRYAKVQRRLSVRGANLGKPGAEPTPPSPHRAPVSATLLPRLLNIEELAARGALAGGSPASGGEGARAGVGALQRLLRRAAPVLHMLCGVAAATGAGRKGCAGAEATLMLLLGLLFSLGQLAQGCQLLALRASCRALRLRKQALSEALSRPTRAGFAGAMAAITCRRAWLYVTQGLACLREQVEQSAKSAAHAFAARWRDVEEVIHLVDDIVSDSGLDVHLVTIPGSLEAAPAAPLLIVALAESGAFESLPILLAVPRAIDTAQMMMLAPGNPGSPWPPMSSLPGQALQTLRHFATTLRLHSLARRWLRESLAAPLSVEGVGLSLACVARLRKRANQSFSIMPKNLDRGLDSSSEDGEPGSPKKHKGAAVNVRLAMKQALTGKYDFLGGQEDHPWRHLCRRHSQPALMDAARAMKMLGIDKDLQKEDEFSSFLSSEDDPWTLARSATDPLPLPTPAQARFHERAVLWDGPLWSFRGELLAGSGVGRPGFGVGTFGRDEAAASAAAAMWRTEGRRRSSIFYNLGFSSRRESLNAQLLQNGESGPSLQSRRRSFLDSFGSERELLQGAPRAPGTTVHQREEHEPASQAQERKPPLAVGILGAFDENLPSFAKNRRGGVCTGSAKKAPIKGKMVQNPRRTSGGAEVRVYTDIIMHRAPKVEETVQEQPPEHVASDISLGSGGRISDHGEQEDDRTPSSAHASTDADSYEAPAECSPEGHNNLRITVTPIVSPSGCVSPEPMMDGSDTQASLSVCSSRSGRGQEGVPTPGSPRSRRLAAPSPRGSGLGPEGAQEHQPERGEQRRSSPRRSISATSIGLPLAEELDLNPRAIKRSSFNAPGVLEPDDDAVIGEVAREPPARRRGTLRDFHPPRKSLVTVPKVPSTVVEHLRQSLRLVSDQHKECRDKKKLWHDQRPSVTRALASFSYIVREEPEAADEAEDDDDRPILPWQRLRGVLPQRVRGRASILHSGRTLHQLQEDSEDSDTEETCSSLHTDPAHQSDTTTESSEGPSRRASLVSQKPAGEDGGGRGLSGAAHLRLKVESCGWRVVGPQRPSVAGAPGSRRVSACPSHTSVASSRAVTACTSEGGRPNTRERLFSLLQCCEEAATAADGCPPGPQRELSGLEEVDSAMEDSRDFEGSALQKLEPEPDPDPGQRCRRPASSGAYAGGQRPPPVVSRRAVPKKAFHTLKMDELWLVDDAGPIAPRSWPHGQFTHREAGRRPQTARKPSPRQQQKDWWILPELVSSAEAPPVEELPSIMERNIKATFRDTSLSPARTPSPPHGALAAAAAADVAGLRRGGSPECGRPPPARPPSRGPAAGAAVAAPGRGWLPQPLATAR